MITFFKALWRGWKIFIKNYIEVVDDIEKQALEYSKLKTIVNRRDVYNYLQRLLKLHMQLFGSVWTVIFALLSIVISVIALIKSSS